MPILLKKTGWNNGHFWTKTMGEALWKNVNFFAYNGVFSLYNTVKELFRDYILHKKKIGIMAIFGPIPWFNRFGKMSIFRHFELLVSIA